MYYIKIKIYSLSGDVRLLFVNKRDEHVLSSSTVRSAVFDFHISSGMLILPWILFCSFFFNKTFFWFLFFYHKAFYPFLSFFFSFIKVSFFYEILCYRNRTKSSEARWLERCLSVLVFDSLILMWVLVSLFFRWCQREENVLVLSSFFGFVCLYGKRESQRVCLQLQGLFFWLEYELNWGKKICSFREIFFQDSSHDKHEYSLINNFHFFFFKFVIRVSRWFVCLVFFLC